MRTSSLDASGFDEAGRRTWRGGNPVTGPFYVEGAPPRDAPAVRG